MRNGKIGYAVAGLGVGLAHADAACEYDKCELVALCDINRDKLLAAGEKYAGAVCYESFDELIADPCVDIISICLPSGMHADFAVRAMEAGKHVLIEKPIDITVDAAKKVSECAKRTGMRAGVVFQNRNNAVMKPVKEAVDSGRLGKLILGTFAVKWYRDDAYYNNGWHGTWSLDGGGSLINQSIHTLDIMQWLMGDVESVSSEMGVYGHNIETEDLTASVIKFKSGATATFVSTTCAHPGVSTEISLYGSGGTIELDADRLKTFRLRDSYDEEEEEAEMIEAYGNGNGMAALRDASVICGHKSVVVDMVNAVLENRDPQITPDEGIKSVRIINAIYESARSGKKIYIED